MVFPNKVLNDADNFINTLTCTIPSEGLINRILSRPLSA